MKKLILTVVLVLLVALAIAPTVVAGTYEETCGRAAKYGWQHPGLNTACLYAMMCEIGGAGPDGMW